MGSILADAEILRAVDTGEIVIDPFDAKRVNPVSVDLTLGDEVAVYANWVQTFPAGMNRNEEDGTFFSPKDTEVMDVKYPPTVKKWTINPNKGWVLNPGIGYLMHVRERIHTRKYVPILDGKSSVGRLFIQVHATAGYGDPGFDGQFTLEVIVQHSVIVYPGMPIAQIRFQTIEGEVVKTYDQTGKYNDASAVGAIPSQLYKAFT